MERLSGPNTDLNTEMNLYIQKSYWLFALIHPQYRYLNYFQDQTAISK